MPRKGSWEVVGICGTHEIAGQRWTVELAEVRVRRLAGIRFHRSSNSRLRGYILVLGKLEAVGVL